jgi:hypothetical protein
MAGEQQQQDQVQVPDPAAAYDFLYGQIHAPVFFNKLAQDYGIVPQNEAEAQQLLDMAAEIFAAGQQARQKQASAQGSFLDGAQQSLRMLLGKQAGARDVNAPANDRLVKQAAAELTRNPYVRAAALSYQYHLAQQMQGAA